MNVTAEAARRFLVAHHMLAPARSLQGGTDAVLEVFRRLGSVQFDPLAVAGRNHDLVLHARVADYDPAWCEQLLYERRSLFEAYNKGLSLLPTSELPLYRTSPRSKAPQLLADNEEAAEQVLERICAEGPLSVLDFERGPGADPWGWGFGSTTVVRAVLEAYAVTGVLGLARREGNRRYYDLMERLFPRKLLASEVPLRDQIKHRLLSRYRAHGLLGVSSPAMVGLGVAKQRNELRDELVEEGELVAVQVDGVRGKRFVLGEDAELLASPPEPPPSVAFLAPLDPFDWDPSFLRSLFDFHYVWEVYLPEKKRRWGYYVLPILFRDRLVGRIEPRIDRVRGAVQIIGLWWEEGFTPRRADGFVDAMREALRSYLRFAGASRLEWAPSLGTEKRFFARVKPAA